MRRKICEEGSSKEAHETNVISKRPRTSTRSLISGSLYLTKVGILPDCFNEDAYSLAEILEIIRPEVSIHFNFMIDLQWLLRQYPDFSNKSPLLLVVGQKMGTDARSLTSASKGMNNVEVLSASLPIPFGTHHTKLSLFESNSEIHVMVSTANLVPGDWRSKTQCIYYAKGPLVANGAVQSDFADDLTHYLKQYNLVALQPWIDRLMCTDFSQISDRLVYSVPGYHKGADMKKFGHLSLQHHLSEMKTPHPSTSRAQSRLFVAQCSSIGSLGKTQNMWLGSQFHKAMNGGSSIDLGRFLLVFPTQNDVRGSIEGYEMGGSIPYSKSTAEKQSWLNGLMCKWRSEKKGRSRAMPHCKTYCEIRDGVCRWMVMTSANLSQAAWGCVQKNGTQLAIRSYEMGVLIKDPERIKLPFDYPLVKHSVGDMPWLWDINHTEPDVLGEVWRVS